MTHSIPWLTSTLAGIALSMATGCEIYIGGPDDDPPPPPDCWDLPPPPYDPAFELRNPDTGQCEYWGPIDSCTPGAPMPAWAPCLSECSWYDYDELGCITAPGCRAAYVEGDGRQFIGCWATAPYWGPGELPCEQLDSWTCSGRDDCAVVHDSAYMEPGYGIPGLFRRCEAEAQPAPGCTSDEECGPGWRCEITTCDPEPGCEPGPDGGCADPRCYGQCVPSDSGSCYGEVLCDALPPDCREGTVPGIANGCWTGTCIPLEDCEQPPADCRTLVSAEECLAHEECLPVYGGRDCSCDAAGCTCTDWVFERCDPR